MMMRTLSLAQTLAWYDGPQVIVLKDFVGKLHVGVGIDSVVYDFWVVGVTPEKLRDFLTGDCDLRDLVLDKLSDSGWALGAWASSSDLEIDDINFEAPDEGHLPREGFYIFHVAYSEVGK
jgi:hypothetical protein